MNANPLVSLTITTYNHSVCIERAIQSALSQNYSPLEIIISDDCSKDDTFEVARKAVRNYSGPHQILLRKNPINLGLIPHVNLVLELARGELVCGSSGDDESEPHRCEKVVNDWLARGKLPTLFFGPVTAIDNDSKFLGVRYPPITENAPRLEGLAISRGIYIGAGSAFSKNLLEKFPPISQNGAYEDLVWGFRARLVDALWYIEEPLVRYRVGGGLTTTPLGNSPLGTKKASLSQDAAFLSSLRQRLADLQVVKPREKVLIESLLVRKIRNLEFFLFLAGEGNLPKQGGWLVNVVALLWGISQVTRLYIRVTRLYLKSKLSIKR